MPENNPKTLEPPPITLRLVEWLEQTYPNRLPRTVEDPGALGILIGQQRVVEKLRWLHSKQTA